MDKIKRLEQLILRKIHSYEYDKPRALYLLFYKLSMLRSKLLLRRLDNDLIPEDKNEIRLFVCMRNESLRLPYFLDHCFRLGVSRIFIVDNNSTDKSVQIALSRENVHVFQTSESYVAYMNWLYLLLDKYALNSWAMILDVDEIFQYPNFDKCPLRKLCKYLEKNNYNSVRTVLLDMYSNLPVSEVKYSAGCDPFKYSQYFDADCQIKNWYSLDHRQWKVKPAEFYIGGVRRRKFGVQSYISKIPLFFHTNELSVSRGAHDINSPRYADIQGVVFHFKYFNDFIERVPSEVIREEHYGAAKEYKIYNQAIITENELNLYFESSVNFQSLMQLEELGIVKNSQKYQLFLADS